jgi:3-deoxy-manno-octulosonate cytidylyltransferase (CMP-KDO synthetase)
VSFIVIIPARLASTRLPNKPLADLGGKPMVVRVAERARCRAPRASSSPPTTPTSAPPANSMAWKCMTRADHPSGTDRIAEVARAGPAAGCRGGQPAGRRTADRPGAAAGAAARIGADVPMATCAHPLHDAADAFNPNVVKVVLDKAGRALYFSRATIPWHRDAFAQSKDSLPAGYVPLRHIGLYAYRNDFLQAYPALAVSPLESIEALEQLRVLWHGYPIAVHVTDSPGRRRRYAGRSGARAQAL